MNTVLQLSVGVLFVLSMLAWTATIQRVLRVTIPFAPLCFFSLVICTLYFFSLIGLLEFGALCIFVGGLLLALIQCRFFSAYLSQVKLSAKTILLGAMVAALYLAPVFVLYYNIPDDFYFFENDEYSHWALSSKVIATTNALFGADSGVAFKGYPPGMSLHHYYFVTFLGYTEPKVLLAHILFTLAALAAISASVYIRQALSGALLYLTSIVAAYLFGYGLYSIYMDLVLGAVFAAGLIYACNCKHTKENILVLVLLSSTLILIKSIGLLLTLILCAAYFARNLRRGMTGFLRWRNRKKVSPASRFLKKYFKTSSQYLAVAASIPLLVFFSWKSYAALIDGSVIGKTVGINYLFRPECGRVMLMLDELGSRILLPSLMKFSVGKLELGVSLLVLTILFVAASILIIAISRPAQRTANIFILTVPAVGAALYLAFLFYSYMAFFSMYEAIRLASFERYVSTYYYAWLMVIAAAFIATLLDHGKFKTSLCVVILMLASALAFAPDKFRQDLHQAPSDIGNRDLRVKIKRLADIALRHAHRGDKVYYIGQASKGYDFLMFRYLIAPLSRGQNWCWSLGEVYDRKDVWTCQDSIEKLVAGYNFLVIGNADEKFWQDNRQYFQHEDQLLREGVFSISQSADGSLKFLRIE